MPRHKFDPLLSALISKLPPAGTEWPMDRQLAWLNLMAMAFGTVYGGEAAGQLAAERAKKPVVPSKPFKPIEYPFYIDKNCYARKRGGERILPKDVGAGTLHDLRGEDGDLRSIVWADDSKGLGKDPIIVEAA